MKAVNIQLSFNFFEKSVGGHAPATYPLYLGLSFD
jgi:hypothetical protein